MIDIMSVSVDQETVSRPEPIPSPCLPPTPKIDVIMITTAVMMMLTIIAEMEEWASSR